MTDALTALQPLLDLVGLSPEGIQEIMLWLFALQMLLRILRGWIQRGMQVIVARALESKTKADDAFLRRLFAAWWYVTFAWVIDLLFRIKLPTLEDLPEISSP